MLVDLVLPREQRRVAEHRVENQPLVRLRQAGAERAAVEKVHVHRADRHALARHLRADCQRDSLVRLYVDEQDIRPQSISGDLGERRVRRALELDRDRRLAPREPLAHAHVERRVGPAPVVDEELGGDVRLGHRVVLDTVLLTVGRHLLALDEPGAILTADHGLRPGRVQRAQHFHLLVANRVGGEVDRRLHRRQREQLQQVVLEDVANRAGTLIEARPAFDAECLGNGDLDMVDELAVPDRLEDAVREPQREHVLDGLLAEVVVDPEDLALLEVLAELRGQLLRRREVVAERLLDDEARPAAVVLPFPERVDDRRERGRGDC